MAPANSASLCCIDCFADEGLRRLFDRCQSKPCSFCGQTSSATKAPQELGPTFWPILALFVPAKATESWGLISDAEFLISNQTHSLPVSLEEYTATRIFSAELRHNRRCELLDAIRSGTTHYSNYSSAAGWVPYPPLRLYQDLPLYRWDTDEVLLTLSENLKNDRYLLTLDPASRPEPWLESLVARARRTLPAGTKLWRARLNPDDSWYPMKPELMGAPPSEKALPGRLNPEGVSYLYAAEDVETAIAEVRPHIGAVVTVACLVTSTDLTIADLPGFVSNASPFKRSGGRRLFGLKRLARDINLAMAKPIRPQTHSHECLATQFVAEFLRHKGLAGLRYSSSQRKTGNNISLFEPFTVEILPETSSYDVLGIQYRSTRLKTPNHAEDDAVSA